jgi:hypothetical protein
MLALPDSAEPCLGDASQSSSETITPPLQMNSEAFDGQIPSGNARHVLAKTRHRLRPDGQRSHIAASLVV